MQISQIEELDKKKRIVYIDGVEAFTLYKNEINKYGLEPDKEITPAQYEEILAVLDKRAKITVMETLKRSDKPEMELRSKLKRARIPDSSIDVAIDYVKQYGYLNDMRYTENYIRIKKQSKSKQAIESELRRKGVDSFIIKECMENEYSMDTELEVIQKQIAKKCRDLASLDDNKRNKLIASLCRKGFSYEKVRQCLSRKEPLEY